MRKFTLNFFSALLIVISFLPLSTLNAQIDLELSLSQTIQNPDAWTKYSIVATITNNGPEQAQGIEVAIANPAGTVYQGGNEYTATAGTFNPYNSQGWLIPSLNANGVATLTLNIFTLEDDIAPVYAQVVTASPQDVDSTPNNGVAPTVVEDDEAISVGGQVINQPDLRLADVQIAGSGDAGSVVAYTLDLINSGNAIASGDYAIHVYLSPSAGQISTGTLVGEINTGNTAVGTIDDVNGAISIPANFPAGNWFAVFYVDADEDIAEANENNNIVSIPFEVREDGGPVGDFCGFEKEFFNMPEFIFNPRPTISQIAQEANGNYLFKVLSGNNQVGSNYVDLLIDEQGNQLALNEDADPFPNTENQLSNGGSYEAEKSGNNDLSVLVRDANGNVVFDKNYNDLTSTDRFNSAAPKVVLKNGGYYVYGAWIDSASPNNTYVFLAELDAAGNLQGFIEEQHNGPAEALILNAITVLPSGDLILSIESQTVRDIYLTRINLQGISWSEFIVADLVSNKVPSIQYDAGENSVYVLLFFASEQYVRKVNAANGTTLWTTKLSDEFNPNSNSIRIFNLATSMVITADGGVATGYVFKGPFDAEFQTEIGKLDADGNAVWWRQFDWADVNILEAMFETSDGGIIFAGRTEDKYVVYKLNQNGQPSPLCTSDPTGGENMDLELTYSIENDNPSQWSFFSTTLSISNTGSEAASGVIVNITYPDGVVYRGGNEYTSSQGSFAPYGNSNWNVGTLAAGATALLEINYFLRTADRVDFYAQVIAANEEDADSTPDNGTLGVVNEDDEAALAINSQGGLNRIANKATEESMAFKVKNIFPNPVIHGELNFILSRKESGNPTIQVYNSQGMLVQQEQVITTKGTNQLSITIDQLSSGMYFLMIHDVPSKVATGKFFVERE